MDQGLDGAAARRGPDEARRVIARGDPAYPATLLDLREPPRQLHTLGSEAVLSGAAGPLVAVVGTREATAYGLRVARSLARSLAECGATVVSGMARGIDAAAHDGALAAGGPTIAVLGTGVDVPYPARNRALHRAVAERGLVVAESPDGTRAFPGCFPRRNRIIAALASATIVVEAGFRSGALNTATQALELGRIVAAVPGQIDTPQAAGCNMLIRDGAQVVGSVDDAITLVGLSKRPAGHSVNVSDADADVWHAIGAGANSVDTVARQTGLPARKVIEALGRLEVLGLIEITQDGTIMAAIR